MFAGFVCDLLCDVWLVICVFVLWLYVFGVQCVLCVSFVIWCEMLYVSLCFVCVCVCPCVLCTISFDMLCGLCCFVLLCVCTCGFVK